MSEDQTAPLVVVLAGPNGAGKSTAAPGLLQGALGVRRFVNADVIARGLAAYEPERMAVAAGRIMLAHLRALADERASFAFETTLAGRGYAPWLRALRADGYQVHLVFLWLPSPAVAIRRVADRVQAGGHPIPEATIRRRYRLGLQHFHELYRPLASTWQLCDNSSVVGPRLVAHGRGEPAPTLTVLDPEVWERSLSNVEPNP